MWVVLEGIAGCGKTTVARRLQRELGFRYHHVTAPGAVAGPEDADGSWDEMLQLYLVENMHGRRDVVFDRSHLSEFVYGPERGVHRNTEQEPYRAMEQLFRDNRALVFWFNTDPYVAWRRGARDRDVPLATLRLHDRRYHLLNCNRPMLATDDPAVVLACVSGLTA